MEGVAAGPAEDSRPVATILDPLPLVYGAVAVVECTKPLHVVVDPLALVAAGVAKVVCAQPVAPVVDPHAVVLFAIAVHHGTLAVYHVLLPRTSVDVSVPELHDPLAVLFAVLDVPLVRPRRVLDVRRPCVGHGDDLLHLFHPRQSLCNTPQSKAQNTQMSKARLCTPSSRHATDACCWRMILSLSRI